ncbi:MAG: GntR family transcriptional regulator [Actinobacteria bacterium]|nr:GntR family transcriptional regulator [Actinomycetota bacterium]
MKVKARSDIEKEPAVSVGLTTATARMLLTPDQGSGSLSDQVARRLGGAIRLGLLIDGDRLPTESELAAQMGISTVTLREALSTLREQGLVVTRRGRGGGTFVRAPADSYGPLRQFGVHELQELGDQRAAIRGAAARLAAERALDEEISRLEGQLERLAAASTASERRRADTELAIGIAAAAQSSRLTREETRLRAEVGDLLNLELSDVEQAAIVTERRKLVEAIRKRRPERARALAETQVEAETKRLVTLRLRMAAAGDRSNRGRAGDQVLEEVKADLGRVFDRLDRLAAHLTEMLRREDTLTVEGLAELRPTIFAILDAGNDLVTGAGLVVAPGLLAGSERWLEWWSRTGPEARLEPLRVNLDLEAPDFYDYTTADWFATPLASRRPRLSGPFVDHACTNTWAITLSLPTEIDGEFCGVAAADVLVSSLERRILPRLAGIDERLALVTAEGRVVASNDPALVSGQRLALDRDEAADETVNPVDSLRLIEL